jgi:N,N'-diacetyllegionaminate synthase
MRIGGFDTDERVLIVAEIGNNHEGDLGVARGLVEAAAEAGADAVKFQTFRTEHYVAAADAERFARLKRFELAYDEFAELATQTRALGMLFVSTPFDLASADFLGRTADAIKIASGDNTFVPLIESAARTGLPMLVSAGLADLDTVRGAVGLVRSEWGPSDPGLAVLHCVSAYPVPPAEANLRAIATLAAELDCEIGYSDHTVGLDASPLAVALGARVIEKHFTLDKHYSKFRDHQLSADPPELRELVLRIRDAEAMLGEGDKDVQPSEREGVEALRRSIVAARDLDLGHVVEVSDLTWVRPGGGMAPGEEGRLVGRALRRALAAGERLSQDDVG